MKTKKISWQAIAIVVLALVLIASIALGVSGAWFQDKDAVQQTSKMGEAVTIRLGDTSAEDPVDTWSKLYRNTKPFPGDVVMGNTKIYMGTETPSVVRGKIIVDVKDKNGSTVTLPEAKTNEQMASVEKPVMPDKSADTYWTVDENGNSTFNTEAWNTALTAYQTKCQTYDKQLLANMLAVTLAGNDQWEKGESDYYYYKELATNANAITLFDQLKLSTELSNEVAQWTISVKVSVEAIQAANLEEYTEFYGDLGATIKGKVDTYKTNRNVPQA